MQSQLGMEQYDSKQLLEAASEFANHPGVQNDVATRDFLDRFPLPVLFDPDPRYCLILSRLVRWWVLCWFVASFGESAPTKPHTNALQKEPLVPNFENHLVACLERIFRTNHGASLIPQNMSFVQVGLQAGSHVVRCLACKAVSRLLENGSGNSVQLVVGSEVYTLLLDCLIDGNEEESAAAMDAIKGLACSPQGMTLLFPGDIKNSTDLRCLATKCSPLGRVRVLALVVKLFSVSSSVASMVYNSNLLSLLESELTNRTDVLISLTVLELLYELAEIKHATELLSKTNLIKLLCSLISDITTDTILRSRAMLISGRLLSKENIAMFIDDISIKDVIKVIEGRFAFLECQYNDEFESALEALGQIGSTIRGAELILSNAQSASRHVISAAFDRQAHGRQLAALEALGNIAGVTRSGNKILLNDSGEENLRRLMYENASMSSKLTPSGLFWAVLQQDSEVRIAAYKMLTALVARPWCLIAICTKQEIVNLVTDPHTETTKLGMDSKYDCCKAILMSLQSSVALDPSLTTIEKKLEEAVGRGPYSARYKSYAQPLVLTADRF